VDGDFKNATKKGGFQSLKEAEREKVGYKLVLTKGVGKDCRSGFVKAVEIKKRRGKLFFRIWTTSKVAAPAGGGRGVLDPDSEENGTLEAPKSWVKVFSRRERCKQKRTRCN